MPPGGGFIAVTCLGRGSPAGLEGQTAKLRPTAEARANGSKWEQRVSQLIREDWQERNHRRSDILDQAPRWIAVTSHPHKERIAVENLRRQAFTVYCPLLERTTRHARRTRHVLKAMFPGYLFVDATEEDGRWRSILYTPGVRGLVRRGRDLAFVPGELIDGLRSREVGGVVKHPIQPYAIGQSVRLHGGAFQGLVAKIIELDEKDRLVVLMQLLNQAVKVKLDAHQVEAC